MRNIEFRAYDSRSKIMYPYAISGFSGSIHVHAKPDAFDGTWKDIGCGCDEFADYDGEVTMMQYTGLKDRNDNRIYEGDILVWRVNDISRTAAVYWDEHQACFWMGEDRDSGFKVLNDWMLGEYDILGNLCQNPELMSRPVHMVP